MCDYSGTGTFNVQRIQQYNKKNVYTVARAIEYVPCTPASSAEVVS